MNYKMTMLNGAYEGGEFYASVKYDTSGNVQKASFYDNAEYLPYQNQWENEQSSYDPPQYFVMNDTFGNEVVIEAVPVESEEECDEDDEDDEDDDYFF